jgi:hypothetical protein
VLLSDYIALASSLLPAAGLHITFMNMVMVLMVLAMMTTMMKGASMISVRKDSWIRLWRCYVVWPWLPLSHLAWLA